jgi:hypothetical protein
VFGWPGDCVDVLWRWQLNLADVVVVAGSTTVLDEGGFAKRSLMGLGMYNGGSNIVAVVSSFFTTLPHSSTTTQGSCGSGLGCDDDEECSSVRPCPDIEPCKTEP